MEFQALTVGSMANYSFEAQISKNRRLKTSSCLAVNNDILSYKDNSPIAASSDKQTKHVNTARVLRGGGGGGGKAQNVLKIKAVSTYCEVNTAFKG